MVEVFDELGQGRDNDVAKARGLLATVQSAFEHDQQTL